MPPKTFLLLILSVIAAAGVRSILLAACGGSDTATEAPRLQSGSREGGGPRPGAGAAGH